MGAKKISHTRRSTMCGLKKLASGVFLESWKVLAEWRRWRPRRKRTKNIKSPGYPGWLNDEPVLVKYSCVVMLRVVATITDFAMNKLNWSQHILLVFLDFENLADGWHAHYMGFAVHMLASLPTITVRVWHCWPTINLCDISWICDGVYVHTGALAEAMSNMCA